MPKPDTIVLIHGLFMTALSWEKWVERYTSKGFRVIARSWPGMDGDIAANNGGWQWSAGTGADAAPYFRIQNPWRQTKSYDPGGRYIKTWVPELRDVDPMRFTQPPTDRLAKDYPTPLVDHAKEREETLERFNRARQANKTSLS